MGDGGRRGAYVIRCLRLHDAVAVEYKAVGVGGAALALRVNVHQLLQRRLALDLEEDLRAILRTPWMRFNRAPLR